MKPDTVTAMRDLIQQMRAVIPFGAPTSVICRGVCTGCSKKLIEYLDTELEDWHRRLTNGEIPNLGDVQKLAKACKKIYRVLERNGLFLEEN